MDHNHVFFVSWAVLGAVIGSFLNAFVYRWPRRISLVKRRRSFCPQCENDIAWYDNIPIVSYVALLGRCRACGGRIPARYLAIEVLSAGLFALAFHQGVLDAPGRFGSGAGLYAGWGFVVLASFVAANLLALSFVDIETYTVPVVNTTALMVAGLAAAPLLPGMQLAPSLWTGDVRADAALNSIQGLILGGGMIWATGAAAELLVRKEAMGAGDAKILAGMGAVLGWKAAVAAFFIAPCLGTAVGIPALVGARLFTSRKKGKDAAGQGITYRYEDGEAPPPPDSEVVKSHGLAILGLAIAAEQTVSLIVLSSLAPAARYDLADPSAGSRAGGLGISVAPFCFGASIGFFMVFYDVVRRRLVREDRWIRRQITHDESGATEERLAGHYLPYGPFLAAAALVMLFFGDGILAWASRRFLRLP